MARSGRRSGKANQGSARTRWAVGLSALLMAAIAFYVLLMTGGGPGRDAGSARESVGNARPDRAADSLDHIDAKSREAMRDLLRDAGD